MHAWGTTDPRAAIRSAAKVALEDADIVSSPVELDRVGSFRDVLSVERVYMRESGRLRPTPRGYVIDVNQADNPQRQRFSYAHEIGHILIPVFAENPQLRVDMRTGGYRPAKEEEHLCDVAASELLMPGYLFEGRAQSVAPSIDGLWSLADSFDVSLEATALRAVGCGVWDCAVMVWEEMLKKSETDALRDAGTQSRGAGAAPRPKLRIRLVTASPRFSKHFFPVGKSACEGSLVGQSALNDALMAGPTELPTATGPVVFHAESLRMPYSVRGGAKNRVVTVVHPT